MNKIITRITQRIKQRSEISYRQWLDMTLAMVNSGRGRRQLSCGNLAHVVAANCSQEKSSILDLLHSNLGIVTAYNDMLSAHQPYKFYPDIIAEALRPLGHTCQVAGSVPAMCDGITQGQPGMELSLFSRDIVAQATAISLSHNAFDGTLLLSICDKIAPGQLMGALSFAHLPTAFIPVGPMGTGISNDEKVTVRQQYAAGSATKETLLNMECQAYHSPGTCTFYGTANTNQLVLEAMGLMLPGSAFVAPNSALRHALTQAASCKIAAMHSQSQQYRPLYEVFTAESLVNGLVAWLASGGSTNHSLHMVAIARCAGLILTWDDISELSDVVPLLVRMYPNGPEDINAFQQAGGVPVLMKNLHALGLLNTNVKTAFGEFADLMTTPIVKDEQLVWVPCGDSTNTEVLAIPTQVFSGSGGLKVLSGNIGKSVIKVSAVATEYQQITAPAKVFQCQNEVEQAYKNGELNQDVIVVVTHNGPAANGMPELHKLMPILGNIQKLGYRVALVTDGRLSGASGKIAAAIHVTPEAFCGGEIGLIRDGDMIEFDAVRGVLNVNADLSLRHVPEFTYQDQPQTWGRNLFAGFRSQISSADTGATIFN
ncbi:phosphogluconate dehydratase [Photobacterium kishitanii]|uniref:Phosphogluconate dehydratase n=1 Tax=Photobacterium kishitanii TaxID=318456 RepID=A0AAX0YQS3_9GAMM|nr:phosphogluconate dehydratase [Photobacterium kishitanii]KJG58853.1 phosphogluconate dehydratase [Photobacterium kishitanii]KJG63988.1 phosphogluconate dehydratase [Photobacterium kishitanii]KJG68141.1 phosphogluconate dehydratase [Photobacterium kishitanii]OBU31361.1 phosphogluconate dehydratase [Photobacterium kishitanii]PSV12231.1 phosphogluconate dehydratase [Photobacterium kishitanii]